MTTDILRCSGGEGGVAAADDAFVYKINNPRAMSGQSERLRLYKVQKKKSTPRMGSLSKKGFPKTCEAKYIGI